MDSVTKSKMYGVMEVMERFRLYQWIQYLLIFVPAVIVTMVNINFVFVAGDLNYRCKIPECESQPPQYSANWYPAGVDRCQRPTLTAGGVCSNTSFTGHLETCTSWVYETNDTIVADLDLACDPWRVSLVGTVHNIGVLFATVVAGYLCDRFGRKPTLILSAALSCVGCFKTLTTNYSLYLFIELIESIISGGTYTAATVLMMEIGGPNMRVAATVFFALGVYGGEGLYAVIAMCVPYWKHLVYIIYIPLAFCILFFFIIKESPRWLVLVGRTNEALNNLRLAARINKMQVDEDDFNSSDDKIKEIFNVTENQSKEKLSDIFTSVEIWKRMTVGCVAKFTASFIYYSLMINSVFLPGNKYTNFMLATVMSIPGELMALYFLNKYGRKVPLMIAYVIIGVFCVSSSYVPDEYVWTKIMLFMFGKMMTSMCYTGAITYTVELFPTSARGLLLGICALSAQVGSMLAPMTPILATVSVVLPSIFYAGCSVLTAILLTVNPETMNRPLMNTVAQVNASAKERKNNNGEAIKSSQELKELEKLNA